MENLYRKENVKKKKANFMSGNNKRQPRKARPIKSEKYTLKMRSFLLLLFERIQEARGKKSAVVIELFFLDRYRYLWNVVLHTAINTASETIQLFQRNNERS
jgi:hypothetical protein